MKLKGLTHSIIGAAIDVLKELKPGLDEKLYENALIIELRYRNHTTEQQRQFPVQAPCSMPSLTLFPSVKIPSRWFAPTVCVASCR